jgi:Activator of Hsp90 ATPase homolog 1-like protein
MTMLDSKSEHTGRSIEVEIVTRAHPARVWEAWTDPLRIVEWLADRAVGSIEPGHYLTWSFDQLKAEMAFRVAPQTTPGRLLLDSTGTVPTRLEVLIGAAHDGTRVRLIHSGFSQDHTRDDDFNAIASGWRLALAVLRYYVEFHFGQPRRGFAISRQARFPLGKLAPFYREPQGLQEWLTDGGSLGTPGGRVYLALKSGEILRGDMLADTGTDIAMAWDELAGVLQFRALPVPRDPGSRILCIMGWGWGLSYEKAQQIERNLAAPLEKLERILETSEVMQGIALQSR